MTNILWRRSPARALYACWRQPDRTILFVDYVSSRDTSPVSASTRSWSLLPGHVCARWTAKTPCEKYSARAIIDPPRPTNYGPHPHCRRMCLGPSHPSIRSRRERSTLQTASSFNKPVPSSEVHLKTHAVLPIADLGVALDGTLFMPRAKTYSEATTTPFPHSA